MIYYREMTCTSFSSILFFFFFDFFWGEEIVFLLFRGFFLVEMGAEDIEKQTQESKKKKGKRDSSLLPRLLGRGLFEPRQTQTHTYTNKHKKITASPGDQTPHPKRVLSEYPSPPRTLFAPS